MTINSDTAKEMYLNLLKQVLSHTLWNEPEAVEATAAELNQLSLSAQYELVKPQQWHKQVLQSLFKSFGYDIVRESQSRRSPDRLNELVLQLRYAGYKIKRERHLSEKEREEGTFWPAKAETMVGLKRLDNLQFCVGEVLRNNVPGDLIETGVWRGGACIFMQGVLKANDCSDRIVWVADSFQGLPPPNAKDYPQDAGDVHHTQDDLRVSRAHVEENFRRYDLMDTNVRFLEGWFKDTLPTAPIEKLAVARLDGDMYESTMDGLKHLYPKLSQGGYLIVDDYGAVEACRQAVEDYRQQHKITEPIQNIDWTGVYWQKGQRA